MPAAKPGDIWIVDLGMAAKVRPCLIITPQPRGDDLEVFTVVAHTTAEMDLVLDRLAERLGL